MPTLGSMMAIIGVDLSQFNSAMSTINDKLKNAEREASSSWSGFAAFGSQMTSVGMGLSAAVTAPLLGIAGASAQAFSGFEQSMNRVSALGEIVGKDLDKLKAQAIDLGAKTQFSAKQAADGMGELAAAGFKATDVMAAMPGVLNLAAAGQVSVGQAAETTAALMGGFGIKATDVGSAVDIMAKAAASGALGISDMGLSFKYIGPVATATGMSFTEAAAAVTLLSNAGIKGEMAGTSLRQAISRLIDPPKAAAEALDKLKVSTEDSSGKMRPFADIIEDLGRKGATTKDIFAIFGDTAASSMQSLVNTGAPALRSMTAELANSEGAAAKMAGTINGGLTGAWERAKGSIETAGITLGESLAPILIRVAGLVESGANQVAEFGKWFATLPEPVQTTAIAFGAVVTALGPALIALGATVSAVASLGSAFTLVGPTVLAFAGTTVPAAIAAIGTFAATSIPAAISALAAFATTAIPQAVTAVAVISEAMLVDATGSFLNFAKTAVPAAIAAVSTFVTTSIPAAVTAVSTFSLTTIPQLTASLVSLSSTGIAGATASLATFASTAIPAAIASIQTLALTVLPILGVAASVGAAAFAGWNIGKWAYDAIPGVKALGDGLASLILYVPGVQSLINKMSGLTEATADLAKGTKKLEELAAKLGVNISDLSMAYKSGALTLEKYNDGLNALLRSKLNASKAAGSESTAQKGVREEYDKGKLSVDRMVASMKSQLSSVNAVSAGMTDYVAKTEPVVKRNAVLDEVSRILTQRYQANVHAIAEARIKLMEWGDAIDHILPISDTLNKSIQEITFSSETLRKASAPLAIDLSAAIKAPIPAAQETGAAIDGIASNVEGVVTKSKSAWDRFKVDMGSASKDSVTIWDDWGSSVNLTLDNFVSSAIGKLWKGDLSFGKLGMDTLKNLGKSLMDDFAKVGTDAMQDLMKGSIADLMGGKGFGGIMDRVKDLGKTIGDVFGKASGSIGETISGAATGSTPGDGSAPSTGSTGASSGGSGISGAINMITGAVSAISGVVSAIYSMRQEGTLNVIERNTRYAMMFLGEHHGWSIRESNHMIADNTKWALDRLASLMDRGDYLADKAHWSLLKATETSNHTYWIMKASDIQAQYLEEIRDSIRAPKPMHVTIHVSGAQAPQATANSVAATLRTQLA